MSAQSPPRHRGSSIEHGRRSISGNQAGRTSVGSGARTSLGPSGIPRAGMSRISAARAATTQPSFDFLTGGETRIPAPATSSDLKRPRSSSGGAHAHYGGLSRQSSNENMTPRASMTEAEIAELKAEIKALQYTLREREQEAELVKLRQEAEIREVRRKGDEDFRKMQVAEGERKKAVRMWEEVGIEVKELRDEGAKEREKLERRVRDVEAEMGRVVEEEGGKAEEREALVRELERKVNDGEARIAALEKVELELKEEVALKLAAIDEVQARLVERESEVGRLESDVLRLKAQTGDVDTLGVIKRELSEQVAHIRTLEATNREQLAELKGFRKVQKSIEVVEEEKRALQRKVDSIEGLQRELGEAQMQRQRLEDERLAWTAYLQSQGGEDENIEFESPEALARALIEERLQTASMLAKLGDLEPALSERDSIIKTLESEKATLESQIEKLKASGGDAKARLRLERQRTLALKEVEYLRAQIKTFDVEESTMELQSYDEAKALRIQQLEDMVAKYSSEVQSLHAELSAMPSIPEPTTKRPRDETDDHDQLGQLSRKNRKLQDDLSSSHTATALLQKELSVTQARLQAATQQAQTRILALRANPTAATEAIKLSTLTTLQSENAALLTQLRTHDPGVASVPMAALEAKERELAALTADVGAANKRMARLKQVWGAKTLEFKEGIRSLLGWEVDFLPNGKMRVTSLFLPGTEESENSIVFDGENGTMKVSGGPRSLFAQKIKDDITYWVAQKGEIPCLLAQLTIRFYEESAEAPAA